MADVHVWEEDEVDCRAKFFGFSKVTTCKFNFYEGTKKVATVDAVLEGGASKTAKAKHKTRLCTDDEAKYELGYKLEVDGKEKGGLVQTIHVWAKNVTIEAFDKDGAPMPDCGFSVQQLNPRPKKGDPLESKTELKTDAAGKIEHRLAYGAGFWGVVLSPHYRIVNTPETKPRKKTYTVAKGFKAKLLFPVEGDEHIQWVNMPADPAKPDQGFKIKVSVAPEDPTQAAEGAFVFWKVKGELVGATQAEKAAGRTQPTLRSAFLNQSGEFHTGKTTLNASLESDIKIDLNHSGGDKCIVSVGGTPEANDAEVTIVNWRKLRYEMAAPTDMALADVTLDDGTAAKGFPATLTDWFTERLDKGFVKFVQMAIVRFDHTDATMAPAMYKSEYIEKPAGTHVCILADWGPAFDKFTSADPRTVKMSVCDYVMQKAGAYRPKPELTTASLELDVFAEYGDYTFEKSMDYASNGGGTRVTVANAKWMALPDHETYPNHPGIRTVGTDRERKTGDITVDATTFEWVNWKKIKITLPATPAALVGASSATKCPIQVSFDLETAEGYNGSAGGGKQTLVFSRPPESVAATTCHELGHSMGQTVYPSGGRKRKPPKGMPYPKLIPKGDKYDDSWGHTGSHCAFGLTAKDKKKKSPRGMQGSCLMFGSGGNEVPPARDTFCPECLKYIQARRLDDIVADFGKRADDDL